jgi:Mn2+/Fe2+ NRAMP family transporter
MKDNKQPYLLKRLTGLILALGPGIFCMGYTIGTGSVTAMIKAGSQFGMQLLWVLALSAFFAGVLMEVYGRFAAVTGQTAVYAFKTHLRNGKFWAIVVICGVVLGQWSSLSGILSLTSHAFYEMARLFLPGLPQEHYTLILIIAIVLIILMYGFLLIGRYSFFEKLLVVFVAVMAFSFLISIFIEVPAPDEIARGLIPSIPVNGHLMVAAFVGTTMAAPTFIVRPLIVKEKGWKEHDLKQQSRDALTAAILMFVVSAAIMISATGALFHKGLSVTRVMDMVTALEPVAGKFAIAIFMVGAVSAGLSSIFPILMVLPLLIGDYKNGEMDVSSKTFRILTAVACAIGLTVPILGTNPIVAQIATQVANVFILPVVIGGGILLINSKKLLDRQRAGLVLNGILIIALVFSLIISYTGILGLQQLLGT